MSRTLILFVLLPAAFAAAADELASRPLESVAFTDDRGRAHDVKAAVLVEAQDGGLLLVERDGTMWAVDKERVTSREKTAAMFSPFSPAELGEQLRSELGERFEIVVTKHYVIAADTGKVYAQWCGSLFERLYASFHTFWTQRGLELEEPQFPLAAIVFASQSDFAAFATKDAGPDTASAKGYFNISTNRMVLYDLTAGDGTRGRTEAEIVRRLSRSPYNVATVVHEATHQIAFNSGMHTRLADNPVWVTEGMAMFFETPDLTGKSGWKTVGAVNPLRHRQFIAFLKTRPAGSLKSLLADDKRATGAETYPDAYAEAWAMTYFLVKTKKTEYVEYLKNLSHKPRLEWDDAPKRLADFQAAFGDDLDKLDAEMVRYVRRLR